MRITIISSKNYIIIKRIMSSQIPQQYIKKLRLLYDQINISKAQHITKQQLKQWLNLCLNDQDISQNTTIQQLIQQFDQSYELWINSYLRQVCGLEPENIEKLQFKEEQAVEFFSWILDTQTSEQQPQQPQQPQQEEGQTQYRQNNNQTHKMNHEQVNLSQNISNLTSNKSSLKQNPSKLSHQTNSLNNHNLSHSNAQQQHSLFTQQQPNEFSQDLTQSEPVQTHHLNQLKNLESSPQLTEEDQRYKQYLETIFQHYCKISFGLTKDNTFESMQKNVSIITMNKFMIFSNDFELNILLAASLPKQNNQKPNKIHIRNLLMDVFKKNSAFHKEMNFQQFLIALQKIAIICFTRMRQSQLPQSNQKPQQIQQTPKPTKFSFEMVRMLKYLEISSFKQFKQKMTKFNINFSLRFNKQLQQKKVPINYKFKFESQQNHKKISQHNEKSVHNQNKPPILPSQKRNIVLKQGEHNINRQKYSLQMGKPPLQNKMSTPNMISMAGNNYNVPKDKKVNSNKNISSHQKLGNVPINRQRNVINFNHPPQKVSKQSLEKLRTPVPSYQGVLQGYANIHLAKKGLLPPEHSKNGQIPIKKKGEFQLNNVIEEARKQTQDPRVYYDYLDSRSGRALSNISASKPLTHYSRDPASNQSYRQSRNDEQLDLIPNQSYGKQMKKNFTEIQGISKKNSRVISVHNELEGLIDFNDSDEDQYLHKHLKKEKENDTEITVRVQKKISSLNFKP